MTAEKLRRLRKWRNGIPVGPTTLELNLTNRCNLTCQSCWQREFPFSTKDSLSTERVLALIREAAVLGVREVRIPGAGEPLLRRDLFDIMGEVKRHGMHGLLITNGTLWTEEKIRRTVKMGWDVVTFSIDAPNAGVNDALRGKPGTFERITKHLRTFRVVKNETGSSSPLIRFNMVLSNRNYTLLPEMVEFARKYGCEDLQVQPMTVWGSSGKALELSVKQREELPDYVKHALDLAQEYGIHTNLAYLAGSSIVEKASGRMDDMIAKQTAHIEDRFLSLPCFEPFYNFVILPDGTASFCSVSGGKDGDSIHNKTLKDVWLGKPYQTIRQALLDKNFREYCKRCCSVVNMENNRLRQELLKRDT